MTSVRGLLVGRARGASAPRVPPVSRGWTAWIGLGVALAFLLLVLVGAFFPQLLTPRDPLAVDPVVALQPPSLAHIFGTDHVGRDLFARVVYGSQLSLQGSVIAVLLALGVGTLLGLISGYLGGIVDTIIMRIVDVFLAIPALLLSMSVVAALGFGTLHVAISVGIASVAVFARLMRSEVYRVRTMRYIEAARLVGSSRLRVLFRHVLPNSIGTVLTLAALEFGGAILAFSALSFLGYGAQPPAPEWGSLINEGREYLATAWWLTTLPGLVVVVTVLAANRVSRALDPEQRIQT